MIAKHKDISEIVKNYITVASLIAGIAFGYSNVSSLIEKKKEAEESEISRNNEETKAINVNKLKWALEANQLIEKELTEVNLKLLKAKDKIYPNYTDAEIGMLEIRKKHLIESKMILMNKTGIKTDKHDIIEYK